MSDWKAAALLVKSFEREGTKEMLGVTIQTDSGLVVAIQSTLPPRRVKGMVHRAEHVFGDHGHKVVGTFSDLAECIRAAENFAKQWQFGRSIERCDCEPIENLVQPPKPFTEEELLRTRTTLPAPPPGDTSDE